MKKLLARVREKFNFFLILLLNFFIDIITLSFTEECISIKKLIKGFINILNQYIMALVFRAIGENTHEMVFRFEGDLNLELINKFLVTYGI